MNRRTFLKGVTALAATGGLLGSGSLSRAWATSQHPENIRNYHPEMRYRPHGLTGVSVSALGFGMLRLPMLPDGKTVYEAQKMLGHRDPRTTMRYAHLGQASLLAAAETMCGFFTSPTHADSTGFFSPPVGGKPLWGKALADQIWNGNRDTEQRIP